MEIKYKRDIHLFWQDRETTKSCPAPPSPGDRTAIIFTLKNQVGNLARALQVFQELGINVMHIELQPMDPEATQVSVQTLFKIQVVGSGNQFELLI